MRGWLLANAFIVVIILVAAGMLWGLGAIARLLPQWNYAWVAVALLSLFAAYFFGLWLWQKIAKRV